MQQLPCQHCYQHPLLLHTTHNKNLASNWQCWFKASLCFTSCWCFSLCPEHVNKHLLKTNIRKTPKTYTTNYLFPSPIPPKSLLWRDISQVKATYPPAPDIPSPLWPWIEQGVGGEVPPFLWFEPAASGSHQCHHSPPHSATPLHPTRKEIHQTSEWKQ